MKNRKSKIIGLFATSALFVLGGIMFSNPISVNAKSIDYATYMKSGGAGVRVKQTSATDFDDNGIRFISLIGADKYAKLEALEESTTATVKADYGMIIAPYDYENTYGAFTKDNLFSNPTKYYIDGITTTEKTEDSVELGCYVSETLTDAKDSTDKAIYCSLVNIAQSQLTREFVGVPFIRITTDGVAEYYVGSYTAEESRSMAYVAQVALQDEDNGLTDVQKTYLKTNYLNNESVSNKQYTYTIETILIDPTGEETVETTVGEKSTIGSTVSVEVINKEGYTYDEEKSVASDIVYANNRTILKLYYTQNHHDLSMKTTNADVKILTTGEGVTENYLLSNVESYQFTVTPTTGYNMNTTTVTANEEELTADDAGVYTVDLSGYGTNDALDIVVNVKAYMPRVVAGDYSKTPSGALYKDLVSLTDVAEGEFEGSRKYVNPTSGNEGSDNKNWGESGLWFQEVRPNHPSASALQTFADMGGYCIKMDFYLENATALCLRLINAMTTIALDTNVTIPSAYTIVDKEYDTKVNRISKGKWYTLYIVPGGENRVNVYMNGGSAENPSVMYIKNVSYETEMPFTPTLGVDATYASQVSIEYQESGEFAGAYKYTNGNGGRYGTGSITYGESGVYFNEVYAGGTSFTNQDWIFFTRGYQYVKFELYIDESVTTIDFRNGDKSMTTGWHTVDIGTNDNIQYTTTSWNSDVWTFYDAEGNQVNTLAYNTWYTVVVTPVQGKWFVVQSNGVGAIMYFKNMEYLKASA